MTRSRRNQPPYVSVYSIRSWEKCSTCGRTWTQRHTCWGRMQRKQKRKTIAQILAQLDCDALDFIRMVAFLGGTISATLLDRLRKPKLTWGSDGEIQSSIYDDVLVVTQRSRCDQAIQDLKKCGLLSISDFKEFAMKCTMKQIEMATQDRAVWQLRAVRAVLHTFPEHRHLEPAQYATIASAILPQLQHILKYSEDILEQLQQTEQRTEAANVCISASYFLDIGWKNCILRFADLLDPQDQTWARIQLRRMTLARIAERTSPAEQLHEIGSSISGFSPCDKRSNAHYGEMRLFQARLLVDLERHADALAVLRGYQPLEQNTSRLEQIQLNDFCLLRGEVLRYQGKFAEARNCFLRLMDQPEPRPKHIKHINDLLCPPPPPLKLVTHLSAVSCELGYFQHSIQFLSDELHVLGERGYPLTGRNATRVRLGLAEVYLMKVISSVSRELEDETRLVQNFTAEITQCRALLDDLQKHFSNLGNLGKVGKITHFRVTLASAIVEHLTGDPWHALSKWELVLAASRQSWPIGYTDAIITLSKADLMYRVGFRDTAVHLECDANHLLHIQHVRYYFTGFGTIWPQYIQTSIRLRAGRL